MARIDITVPKSWDELTQDQLRFVFTRMVRHAGEYAWQKVATHFILRYCGIKVVTPYAYGWLVRHGETEFFLDDEQMAQACRHMEWLSELPDTPVRLDKMDGHIAAYPAEAYEVMTFEKWIACENLYQGYQHTQDDKLLQAMAVLLYDNEDIAPSQAELLSVFYWWTALKGKVSAMFPHFYRPAPVQDGAEPTYDDMRNSVDSQIRALTKGDITKEHLVLEMPAARALTELDALAREYEELNRKYPSKS